MYSFFSASRNFLEMLEMVNIKWCSLHHQLNKYWRHLLMTPVYSDNLHEVMMEEAHIIKKW